MSILPAFRYHPDPLDTGSSRLSDDTCHACGLARGYVYTGPVWSEADLRDRICPWCIGDGTAAERFDATFVSGDFVGPVWDRPDLPERVLDELTKRTPGFIGWQHQVWWAHCGDAGEFLGLAGYDELVDRWPQAIEDIRRESGYTAEQWAEYFPGLGVNNDCTAYVFRCLRCGSMGGYSDCS